MCGILLAVGDAFRADFDAALATLKSRGPDAREVLRAQHLLHWTGWAFPCPPFSASPLAPVPQIMSTIP
jgi:hypothetical protein